jgi:N utilization substance protein A
MLSNIKITQNEMRYMALLENMTGATIVDCIIEEDDETVIFAVKKGEVGLAVGKGGEKIKRFRRMTNKQVEIYEYIDDAERFIRNALKPAKVKEIRLVDRVGGDRIAMVNVETKDKGIAIGRNGQNIKKIRFLAQRYFGLDTIVIN